MARLTPTAQDNVLTLVEAVLTAPGQSTTPTAFSGRFNVSLWGAFEGTAVLERSFNGGSSWIPCASLGQPVVFDRPFSETIFSSEEGILYRVRVLTLTSGAIQARLSQ
ncbi:MAG: hypothetical protein ACK4Z0_05760 [Sphingomonadaceae bacterium]